MVKLKRWLRHAFMPPWRWRLAFPRALLDDIENAISASERLHHGELRFAIENGLAPGRAWRGVNGRQRALEVFSNLRVWDTEENSGILIYLLLADHEVHIVADRGIARLVDQSEWNLIARNMESAYHTGDFRQGSLIGIEQISELLARHFPAPNDNPNELSNRPVIIRS